MKKIIDKQQMRNARAISLLMFMCGSVAAFAAPATWVQSVTYNSETITMRLTRENLRGGHFELLEQNSSGTYDTVTPVAERSYLGTVDEYPGAISCGILKDDGTTFWGAVYFDRGGTWYTSGTAVYYTRALGYENFPTSWFHLPWDGVVSKATVGTTMWAYDVGIDVAYDYYLTAGSDTATAFEQIEFSVTAVRAIYMRDVLLCPYLGRVIIRTDETQDLYSDPDLYMGPYLDAVKWYWNSFMTDANRDVVAGVSPIMVGQGLAWVYAIGTGNAYSIVGSDGNGDFSITWRHEMGHNWGCGHFVGGSPEGAGLMGGNQPGRFSGSEAHYVVSYRNTRLGALDSMGTYTAVDIPPYGAMDVAALAINSPSASVTIDVLGNDYDANNDSLTITSWDSLSAKGASITLSSGTGPGGRDELTYTGTAELGTDGFYYTITDSSGSTASGAVVVDVYLADMLEGYWNMDEGGGGTTYDDTSNNNDGTINGATWTTGRFGSALQFDGSDDYINIPNSSSLNPTDAITVSAWIKADTWGASYAGGSIVSKEQWDAGNSGYVLRCGDNGKLSFAFGSGGHFPEAISGSVMSTGTWYHVAGTYDGSTIKVYINGGSPAGSTSHSGSIAGSGYPVNIGRGTYDTTRCFDGAIDDVRIYDYCLDQQAVTVLASDEVPVHSPAPFDNHSSVAHSILSWGSSPVAVQYHVYLGTDQTSVLNADTSDPEYQGAEAGTAFNATLSDDTTYYWRVDAETASSTATGDVWTFTTVVVESLETGLEGYWPLDETSGVTAADRSTNSNNGTVTNTTFDAGSVTGKLDNALQFDGANDYINVPDHSSLNPTDAISVAAWIKADAWGLGYWKSSIVDTTQWNSGTSGYVLRCGDNYAAEGSPTGLGKLSFSLGIDASFPHALSGMVMSTGTWYHVAGTYDGTTIRAYINGSEVASTPETRAIPASAEPLYIGTCPDDTSRLFDGAIDDVGIWDRALSTSEIEYLYNGGTGRAILYTLPGDFEPDGDVDGADLSYLLQRWLFTGCVSPGWCQGADLNHSGEVDLYDFAIFAENYLK